EAQSRFMVSISTRVCLASMFLILPITVMMLCMASSVANAIPKALLPWLRFILKVFFSCQSIGHSAVFLCKSVWFIKMFKQIIRCQFRE
ncbi:hypothetical protein PMAYCL1PPCAC_04839, partial [Pristionchus mayeri]